MSEPLLRETVTFAAPVERLWPLFFDVDALRRSLPGCESLRVAGENVYEGVIVAKVQFVTLRVAATARLLDLDPPRHVRLELTGRPLDLAGSFVVSVPIDLSPADGGTRASYSADLQMTGRLAAFGAPLLREAVRRQIAELVRNLERELAPTGGEGTR